jgi:hypothetical protein
MERPAAVGRGWQDMAKEREGIKKRIQLEEGGKRVLDAARTELYMDMRFMGAALSSLSYEMDLSTTTVGTDAVSIRFNPSHVLRLFVEEPGKLNRTYIHMLLHCIFRHMYTSERYADQRLFDLCADIVVESILDGMDYRSIYRVSSDFRDRWYELLNGQLKVITVERLYRFFSDEKNCPDEPEYEKLEREFKLDDHSFWLRLEDGKRDSDEDKKDPPLPEDSDAPQGTEEPEKKKTGYMNPRRLKKIRDREKDWDKEGKRLETEIETIGKNAGDKLGKLSWILRFQNTKRRDYSEFLERFKVIREEGGIDLDTFDYGMYAFGLDHYGNMPLIEENEFREVKKVQELVIAIDTSASCKDEMVQRFLDETGTMLLTGESFFQKINIVIIECDDQVQKVLRITSKDDLSKYSEGIHIEGGFGTDFRPVFEEVERLRREQFFENLKGLIYFTDGYGVYPDKPTDYDTAFVFIEDTDYEDEKVPDWALKLYMN